MEYFTMVRDLIKYVSTDISIFEGLGYISDYKDYEIRTGNVLSTSSYLYSTRNYYGEYIVLPKDPTLNHIHGYISKIIN